MDSPQAEITSNRWRSLLEEISGLPECPECETVYNDPSYLNSDRVLDSCGHPKCRKCFIQTNDKGRPCAQCCTHNPYEVVQPRRISSKNYLINVVKEIAKKPKCPECQIFWDEQQNSGPVLIVCGHFKCRKCFIVTIAIDSCRQCKAENS